MYTDTNTNNKKKDRVDSVKSAGSGSGCSQWTGLCVYFGAEKLEGKGAPPRFEF